MQAPSSTSSGAACAVPDGSSSSVSATKAAPAPRKTCWQRWRPFLLKHFLPLGLLLAILLGLTVPQLGVAVASLKVGDWGLVQTFAVCLIFIISGLTLKTDDIKKALRAWQATAYGIVSINFLTPLLALVTTQLAFLPREFQYGFLLFCTMPTTINSGVALANAAGGNFALALLLTVSSNVIGIFSAPFYLSWLLRFGGVSIDAAPLFIKLMLTLLLPLVIGKAARELSPAVLARVKQHKTFLSNFSSFCLILVPWMKLSVSQATLVALDASSLLALLACALLLHLVYLGCNYAVARHILRLSLEMRKSLVIMTSQKTLPMAMTVLSFFPESLGEPGLIAIPCIVSHLVQLFVDAFLAAKWAKVTTDVRPVGRSALSRRARGEDSLQLARHDSAGGAGGAGSSSDAAAWVEEAKAP